MLKLMEQYILNVLVAVDQLGNALLGGCPDETVSARLGREYPSSWIRKLVDFIFGKGHCKDVAENGDSGKAIIK